MKQIYVVTDPGLDPDDILAAWLLAKMQKEGLVRLLGMTANYSPAIMRARLLKGLLNSLGANLVPVAIGTHCNAVHQPRSYEFDFPLAGEDELCPSSLFRRALDSAKNNSVSLLLISGLTDINYMIAACPDLLKQKIKEVYIMGGASWEGNQMVVDPTASNNKFDEKLNPQKVYDFFIKNGIPLRVLTRYAAYKAAITPQFYEDIKDVNAVGSHLHKIQQAAIFALWQFANSNPSGHRQNRQWFCNTFCGLNDLPTGQDESPWQFVKKLSIYDPLTVMWMVYPEFFCSEDRNIGGVTHQIVGVSPALPGVLKPATVIRTVTLLLRR